MVGAPGSRFEPSRLRRQAGRAALGAVVVLLVASCGVLGGDDSYPDVAAANQAAPAARRFADTEALLAALDEGGLACRPGPVEQGEPPGPGEDPRPDVAFANQECKLADQGNDIVTAWVFADRTEADDFIAAFVGGIETTGGFDLILRGANWMLTSSELDDEGFVTGTGYDALTEAQTIIGGRLDELDAA